MDNLTRVEWQGKEYYATGDGEQIQLLEGESIDNLQSTVQTMKKSSVKQLAPVIPHKIIAVGLNYIDHARELKMEVPKEPILFMKPATSLIGPEDYIIYPDMSEQVDYEAELVVVIGREAYKLNAGKVQDSIFGYTCGNDVTARDLQRIDGQWTRAKSFNTFCPIGPVIITNLEPSNLEIKLNLNGQQRQSSNTSNMIFDIEYLVHFVSQIMTLYPGDIIMTGTPPGVGSMLPDDIAEVEIEKIGILKNQVKSMI